MNIRQAFVILTTMLLLSTSGIIQAADIEPSTVEVRREEFLLKQRMNLILMNTLKDQYLGMAINIKYVLIHDPIVSEKAEISQLKLPGFGTQITIAGDADGITGYIDKYVRYRTLIVITKNRIPQAIQESVARMMKQEEDLEIGGKDSLSFTDISGSELDVGMETAQPGKPDSPDNEDAKRDKVNELVKRLGEDRTEKQERISQLFPELEQPLKPVDPRQEAEGSKHLILSKKAYYNNDLNAALNEVIEAININPYASKSYEMLGSIYYRLKWYNLALNNWEKALVLDPDNQKLNKYIVKVKREL
jgi:Tetratricopeptide repeat